MKRITCCAIILICVFLLPGCKRESEKLKTAKDVVERGLLPSFVIKGESIPQMTLTDRMRRHNVPGVSIAVINNMAIELAQGYGVMNTGSAVPVTPETLFQAASISKLVSAMLVLSFVESGELGLDEDVNRTLQSWKVPENQYTQEKKVTLRGILSHSAGLTVSEFRGYNVSEDVPVLIQILEGQKPANSGPVRVAAPPASVWRYSGGGYVVAQQLLEDVTGKSFPEIAQEMIFERLDMKHSTFEQPLPLSLVDSAATGHWPDGYPVKGKWHTYPEMAAAGLWTTPSDLARLAIEIQQSKAGRSIKVLSPGMTNTMLTPQIGNSGFGAFVKRNDQVTWSISGGSNVGFRCFMTIFMETGQGAIVMTNSDNGHYLAMEIIRGLANFYDWPDFRVQAKGAANVDPAVYNVYEGEYEFVVPQGVMISIKKNKEQLTAEFLGNNVVLYPESETNYFDIETGMKVSFIKDADGNVNNLILIPPLSSHQWRAKRRSQPEIPRVNE